MSLNICRIGARVVSHRYLEETNRISAVVKLRYNFPNSLESVIFLRVECQADETERWRKTIARLKAGAWGQLEMYFDGTPLGADTVNVFSNGIFEGGADPQGDTSELSPEEEKDLQLSLRQIEQEFAA